VYKRQLLHRKIDHFTDRHPLVKQSSARLNSRYKRYSGIVVDVFYDHFLAANWLNYSNTPLSSYVTKTHRLLLANYFKLPNEVKRFLPFLIKSRRLETYQHIAGIERSLTIMSGYSSLPDQTNYAIDQLTAHYDLFQEEFSQFFPELQEMVTHELAITDLNIPI
jgi:acyl carrier protein phosphodiesterase